MLSRIAREFAAEIRNHDWSDAPYRVDRAGHSREHDGSHKIEAVLDHHETGRVVTNVMWVAAQVLMHQDPNLDLEQFAEACGVPDRIIHKSDGKVSGYLTNGIRRDENGAAMAPDMSE